MEFIPHEYQKLAIQKVIDTPRVGLFLDMGLGKTVITLTAIDQLMYWDFEVAKVLVIAPLRVAEDTWSRECQKWEHLKHIKIVKVLGKESVREKAICKKGDIYIKKGIFFILRMKTVCTLTFELLLHSFWNCWVATLISVKVAH